MTAVSFNKRLLLAQEELMSIILLKNAKNPFFKSGYLTLDKLLDTVVPVLNKHGIILLQPLMGGSVASSVFYIGEGEEVIKGPALKTVLQDSESSEHIQATTPMILSKADPQGVGSAITYFRRYALMSILGLAAVDEDDDANVATFGGDDATSETSGESGAVL